MNKPLKKFGVLFSMLLIGNLGYSQAKENTTMTNQTTTERTEPGKTEEFRLVEATNNQERMVNMESTKKVEGKTVISKLDFEAQSKRGQEYILAHPELFIVEKK
jgi:hypothetical protein